MKQVIASLVMLTVLHGWGIQPAAAADQKHPAKANTATIERITIPEISSLTLNPNSVTGGAMVTGTLALKVPAPSGGVKVTFKSSKPAIAAVPSGTVVQAGATSATFIVQTYPLVVNPNVVNVHAPSPGADISVRIGNSAATVARLTILPPILATLTLNPNAILGGGSSTGTVTISGAAPTGGIGIALSAKTAAKSAMRKQTQPQEVLSVLTTEVSVPSEVVIPAGSATATFPVTTKPVAVTTTYEIDAVQGAFIMKNAALTLQPPAPPTLSNVTLSPYLPIGGTPVTATLSLTAPAPQAGMTFQVRLDGSMVCGPSPTAPASVQIAGGATSGTFSINTYPAFGTISIWVNGKGADLTIRPPIVDAGSLQFTSSVKGGTTAFAILHLNGAAVPLNCVNGYSLKSSNTQLAKVPALVVVTHPEQATPPSPSPRRQFRRPRTSPSRSTAIPVTIPVGLTRR